MTPNTQLSTILTALQKQKNIGIGKQTKNSSKCHGECAIYCNIYICVCVRVCVRVCVSVCMYILNKN